MARKKPTKRAKPKKVLGAVNDVVLAKTEGHTLAFANTIRDRLRTRIERQQFQSFKRHPLKPATIERKKQRGLDTRVMIATEEYKNAIAVHRTPDGIKVGFAEGEVHKDSGLKMTTIARIHDRGTHTVPARPHWRPTFEEVKREKRKVARDINTDVVREVRKRLKTKR